MSVYRRLLEHLRDTALRASIWCARPGEIASWWRERSMMRLERGSTGKWRVTGPGASRACVAYARLDGEDLAITVEPAEVLVPVTV